MTTVAIIDPLHPNIIAAIRENLPSGWKLSETKGPSPEQHAEAMREADALLVLATRTPAELINASPRLRFIQKMGAGVNNIALDACEARGIGVGRLQAGNDIPVAEHTLLMMLAACRQLPYLDRRTREGHWDKEHVRGINRQITGRVVGLVGMGAIGRKVAELLSGFDTTIIYYDPFRASEDVEKRLKLTFVTLDELIARADIVSLHLPLMDETAGIINASRIRAMKKGSILINCARGGLVDEAALHDALKDGHLFSAGLDAFSSEPPVGSPLLALEEAVITPHCAGATLDNFAEVARRALENTRRFLAGEALAPAEVVLIGKTAIA